MKNSATNWNVEQSKELYGVDRWGADYFDVSDSGHVLVRPHQTNSGTSIDLMEIVSELKERGMDMPVLLRFSDILKSQIHSFYSSFQKAIVSLNYQGTYKGVYPIKVNQQQQVLEELTEFGGPLGHGLEAGSKPELIAALTYFPKNDGYLICNGYKDQEFIDLALYARMLNINSVVVVETTHELQLLIERSKALGIQPSIGLRVKLFQKLVVIGKILVVNNPSSVSILDK